MIRKYKAESRCSFLFMDSIFPNTNTFLILHLIRWEIEFVNNNFYNGVKYCYCIETDSTMAKIFVKFLSYYKIFQCKSQGNSQESSSWLVGAKVYYVCCCLAHTGAELSTVAVVAPAAPATFLYISSLLFSIVNLFLLCSWKSCSLR